MAAKFFLSFLTFFTVANAQSAGIEDPATWTGIIASTQFAGVILALRGRNVDRAQYHFGGGAAGQSILQVMISVL